MKAVATPLSEELKVLEIKSPAFSQLGLIPIKYTCDGENVNPPLTLSKIPLETKTLVLIVDDSDASKGSWLHWLVWNIPPIKQIKENSVPGTEGSNDFKQKKYGGPCPPSGTHHYHFKFYALDTTLNLPVTATKKEVEQAMGSHVLAFGELTGIYKKLSL